MDERVEEQLAKTEVTTSAEPQNKHCEFFEKQEDCDILEPIKLAISVNTEHPASSVQLHTHTSEGDNLNRCEMSLVGSEPPCSSPYSMNDTGVTVDELKLKNYKAPDPAAVSGLNAMAVAQHRHGLWQHLHQLTNGSRRRTLHGDFISRGKDPMLLSTGKILGGVPLEHRSSMPSSSKGNNHKAAELSTPLTNNHNKTLSNHTLVNMDTRPKIFVSSSFSQFFGKQSLKGKRISSSINEGNTECGFAGMHQNEEEHTSISKENSNALLNSSAEFDHQFQPSLHSGCPMSFLDGINLREWLKPGYHGINKVERLHLFRQILQLVDSAHSQGFALQGLWPSCFILKPANRIQYTGSYIRKELSAGLNEGINKKWPIDMGMHMNVKSGVKRQKLSRDTDSIEERLTPRWVIVSEDGKMIDTAMIGQQDSHSIQSNARRGLPIGDTSIHTRQPFSSVAIQFEQKWYAYPEELDGGCLFSSNIYNLGVLLFELLCCFESLELHYAAMSDLRHRILPPSFLAENSKEAAFCLWLLHPEPSSRPTTRDILQSELIGGSEDLLTGDDSSVFSSADDDSESELLLYFLHSLEERKKGLASKIVEKIQNLEADIKETERRHILKRSSNWMDKNLPSASRVAIHKLLNKATLSESVAMSNMLEPRLMRDINQFENAYFYMRSQSQLTGSKALGRSDKNLLRSRDRWSGVQNESEEASLEEEHVDHLEAFSEGICKFARYRKFQVCGTLKNGDLLNSANVICSLSFDPEEEHIAAAGVSKKIKIFEFNSLLNNSVDIHYPVLEMANKSRLSCVCWNNYIKNYLAATDYDGVVKIWDVNSGQGLMQYVEHQRRAWSVDFSQVDPTKFASGSDDCSVKLWNINEKSSVATVLNPANVCCVQFSAYSSHLLAFGSADYKIYCYDLRNPRIPWCILSGHGKAVSHIKFLDSGSLVSASTDNTLKLWDLNKTSLEELSSNACTLTFTGHANEKNFVGLSAYDGYIACGSETNEVYAYYKSLPMAITSHKFALDPISGLETSDSNGQFVSSVCWRKKSNMVVAANSSGVIKLLQII